MPSTPVRVDGTTFLAPAYAEMFALNPFPAVDAAGLPALRELMGAFASSFVPSGQVGSADHRTKAPDGHEVVVRVYRPKALDGPLPCVYAMHGGGFVFGSHDMLDATFDEWCPRLGIVGVSVDYRLSPEHPYPLPLDDCFAGLLWTYEHHETLGIDPDRIGVQGTSAGGGLAAALALLNRDRDAVPVAFQALDCPMIDDRFLTPSSNLERLQVWPREANEFGWQSYLAAQYGTDDVPSYAAPAREENLEGLPPAIVCVGGSDGFRDEDVLYALRLAQAGVPTELHVYPGAPHGAQIVSSSHEFQKWSADVEAWLARQVAAEELPG